MIFVTFNFYYNFIIMVLFTFYFFPIEGCFPIGIEVPKNFLPNGTPSNYRAQSSVIANCKKLGCIDGFTCTDSGNCILKNIKIKTFDDSIKTDLDNNINSFTDILTPMNKKLGKIIIKLPDTIKKEDVIEGNIKNSENSIINDISIETTTKKIKPFDNLINRNYRPSSRLTADFVFKQCCIDRNIPDSCKRKCTYNNYTKETIMQMYLGRDNCPISYARELHFCAAQGTDHTDCCKRKGVNTTPAGDKCLIFCDQRPGSVAMLDTSHLHCYIQFENIKSCFSEKI
uniref:DB domain-containing protein n=1 Tax=Strongyloides stercoralis TaxID=6248 RepID=A0A0K0ES85_STRER